MVLIRMSTIMFVALVVVLLLVVLVVLIMRKKRSTKRNEVSKAVKKNKKQLDMSWFSVEDSDNGKNE